MRDVFSNIDCFNKIPPNIRNKIKTFCVTEKGVNNGINLVVHKEIDSIHIFDIYTRKSERFESLRYEEKYVESGDPRKLVHHCAMNDAKKYETGKKKYPGDLHNINKYAHPHTNVDNEFRYGEGLSPRVVLHHREHVIHVNNNTFNITYCLTTFRPLSYWHLI